MKTIRQELSRYYQTKNNRFVNLLIIALVMLMRATNTKKSNIATPDIYTMT